MRLGHDIRAALADPTDDQLHAPREIVCGLLCERCPDVIAHGAGWTDPARQRPVGNTGRHEPGHTDVIVAAELERARPRTPTPCAASPNSSPAGGAAFVLDPDGVTRTLGTERMARKLRDALRAETCHCVVWACLRAILTPRLSALNRDAFVHDDAGIESTVDLDAHRGEVNLDEFDLGDASGDAA